MSRPVSEWVNGWVSVWVGQSVSGWLIDWLIGQERDLVGEWRMADQMADWLTDWVRGTGRENNHDKSIGNFSWPAMLIFFKMTTFPFQRIVCGVDLEAELFGHAQTAINSLRPSDAYMRQ